jgi:hypothetical protein
MTGGRMPRIVPVSGGPAAPGVIITEQPMLTGGPGIFLGVFYAADKAAWFK